MIMGIGKFSLKPKKKRCGWKLWNLALACPNIKQKKQPMWKECTRTWRWESHDSNKDNVSEYKWWTVFTQFPRCSKHVVGYFFSLLWIILMLNSLLLILSCRHGDQLSNCPNLSLNGRQPISRWAQCCFMVPLGIRENISSMIWEYTLPI